MAYRLSGDWDESRRIGELALEIKERRGMPARDLFRSYNALGLLAWTTEHLGEASVMNTRAAEAARAAGDSTMLGMATINAGLIAKDLGAFSRSREALLLGRDIARSAGDSVNLGRALINLTMLDLALGEPIAAIASAEEARRLARLTADSISEVNALGQLATAWAALGDPQRAFALLDSALAMAERSGRRQEVAEDLLLLGDLFAGAGDHQRALDHYERAQLATDSTDQPEERGNILRSESLALAALGNLTAARDRATEALRIHREGSFAHPELGDLVVLADLAQREGRSDEAAAHLDAAERLANRLEAPVATTTVLIARARVAAQARQWNRVLGTIDRTRGTLYLAGSSGEAEAKALQATALAELGHLEAALAAGRQAIDAIEKVRDNYGTGALRTSYTSAKASVFSQQVLLLLRLGRTDEAFQVADAARGRSLLEHITQARSDVQDATDTRSLIEQEALLRRIDLLLARLREREREDPRERSSGYRTASAELRDSVDALRAQFSALAARNAEVRGSSRAVVGALRPGSAEIRRSLQSDEVLLEYLVTPDQLLIFVVTPSTVTVHAVHERAGSLTSRVQLARELLRQPEAGDDARGVLRALYDIVLGPVMRDNTMREKRRLIVVPHGVLTYLPFAALRDSAAYVVERFELLHLSTSGALPALRSISSPGRGGRGGVFAPEPRALPATRWEAEIVGDLLGGDTYVGARATEGRFRAALQRGGVVHVAAHATLNGRNPLFSRIELAEARNGGSADNGRLEAHELLGLRTDASLVFLSGCETAIGGAWSTRFDAGEDYAALAQTFLYAGARNVVATLWRIDDVGAAEFARHFYEAASGAGYAASLARAQRAMIANPKYRAPYYWAAYQVSGSGETSGAISGAVSDKR